jgi:UDP-glucose 4-epimerase
MVKKNKILVTGGAGYIGSHTCHLLARKGYDVTILDNLHRGHKKAVSDFRLYKIDLREKQKVLNLFNENNYDAVIHFAGLINVGESMEKPDEYLENNVNGSINLLNAMSKQDVKHIVFSSSAAVYGNPKNIPIRESDEKNPTNTYGLTKLIIEQALPFYEYKFGIRHVAFRYFNACGASVDGNNGEAHKPEGHLIPLLIRAILKSNKKFTLFGDDYPTKDGTCIRDYIHVEDLANAHLMGLEYLLAGGESKAFNLGTGDGFSNKEIIEAVKKITGSKVKISLAGRRSGDPAKLIADNSKVLEILKWKPKYSDLNTIIETSYKWHKNNPFTLKG